MLLLKFLGVLLTNYNTTIQIDYFKNKCPNVTNKDITNTNFTNNTNNSTIINYNTTKNNNQTYKNISNIYEANNIKKSDIRNSVFYGCGCSSWPYNTIYATNKICENISNYDNCCLELMKTSKLTQFNNNEKCNFLNSSVYYYLSCTIEPILKDDKKVNVKNIVCFTFIGLVIFSIVSTILVVSVTECKEKLRRRRIRQKDIELNTIMLENELYEDDEDEVLLF